MSDSTIRKGDNWVVTASRQANYDPDILRELYDANADTYPDCVRVEGYVGDRETAAQFDRHARDAGLAPDRTRVIDVACGTGGVGNELAMLGYTVDGADISSKMIDKARTTGAYSRLHAPVNANEPWPETVGPEAIGQDYDGATCAGFFTSGHARASALVTLAHAVRRGGLIVLSAPAYYADGDLDGLPYPGLPAGGLRAAAARLHDVGMLDVETWEPGPYTDDTKGAYLIARVRRAPRQPARVRRGATGRPGRAATAHAAGFRL